MRIRQREIGGPEASFITEEDADEQQQRQSLMSELPDERGAELGQLEQILSLQTQTADIEAEALIFPQNSRQRLQMQDEQGRDENNSPEQAQILEKIGKIRSSSQRK